MSIQPGTPEHTAVQIWTKQEIISQTLRNMAKDEMRAATREMLPEKLSVRQNDMLIAVRRLCFETPEGTSLTTLAARLEISLPSASVMVEALVDQGYLERDISTRDRRAKLIRLTMAAENFYAAGDSAILRLIVGLAQGQDADFLERWHATLCTVEKLLEAESGKKPSPRNGNDEKDTMADTA
jgi:DNA-binding MarR family transcriptional regulator